MNIRVKNGVGVLLTNTLDYWQLLPKVLTCEKRGKQVCTCLSCSTPQLNAPQGHPVCAAVYSQTYSIGWEACVTVAYCPTAWAASHHLWRIKSPFLEGGCCYTESLSWLKTVPTWLCSKQRHLNVALVFWLVSVCCDSPSHGRARLNTFWAKHTCLYCVRGVHVCTHLGKHILLLSFRWSRCPTWCWIWTLHWEPAARPFLPYLWAPLFSSLSATMMTLGKHSTQPTSN